MSSIKIVLRQKKNQGDTLPLAIRITKDRKTSFVHLGQHVKEADWYASAQRVKKSHPNATRLNNFLLKKLNEASGKALELETERDSISSKAIKQKVRPSSGTTFFSQAQDYLNNLRNGGTYNQYTADKPRVRHFKDFTGGDIAFSDITVGLLERFAVYLKSAHRVQKGKQPMGDRTIANHLVLIRSVFAHARKNGLVKREQSPFGEGGMKIKFPDSKKVGIAPEDVKALEAVELPDPRQDHVRKL